MISSKSYNALDNDKYKKIDTNWKIVFQRQSNWSENSFFRTESFFFTSTLLQISLCENFSLQTSSFPPFHISK